VRDAPPSLEEALIFSRAGGDTDTNAAVAGALLGAREGEAAIPPRWLEQLGTRGVCRLWRNDSYKPQALSHKAYDLRLRLFAVFAYRAIRSITSLSMRVMDTNGRARPRQLNRTARLP